MNWYDSKSSIQRITGVSPGADGKEDRVSRPTIDLSDPGPRDTARKRKRGELKTIGD